MKITQVAEDKAKPLRASYLAHYVDENCKNYSAQGFLFFFWLQVRNTLKAEAAEGADTQTIPYIGLDFCS